MEIEKRASWRLSNYNTSGTKLTKTVEELTWKSTVISPGEATSESGVIIFKNLETSAATKGDNC